MGLSINNKVKASAQLNTRLYAVPTSVGAAFATSSSSRSKQREFLYQLIIHNHEQKISAELLKKWGGGDSLKVTSKTFYRLQQLDYITGHLEKPSPIPAGKFDEILPRLIALLSTNNQGVLANSDGLHLAFSGYSEEAAEGLAAMSADLYWLYKRYKKLLVNNLNITSEAFAVVAPDGYSQLGFWPLYIGDTLFFLILGGIPQLQHKAFRVLVKFLATKYK